MSFPEAFLRRRRQNEDDDEFYPNGVRRQPWDERSPSGRTVYETVADVSQNPLQQIFNRIRRDNEAHEQQAVRGGGMSYAEWVRAQEEGRIPPHSTHMQGQGQVPALLNRDIIKRPWTIASQQPPNIHEGIHSDLSPSEGSSFMDAFNRGRPTQGKSIDAEGIRTIGEDPRDYMTESANYLRELDKKGRNWKDKIVDVTDALNAVAGGPKRVIPTKREREMMRAQKQLERDIEIQKQELNQMVPVTLEDGTVVMAPRRTAGTLQSRQQDVAARKAANDERKRMNTARINNWNSMSEGRRQRLIADMYKSGGMNDPELLEYAADQLGIPAKLREKFIAGQMRKDIDENGNIILTNVQTGETQNTGQKTYEVTKEKGRNQRFSQGQEGANYRAGLKQGQGGGEVKLDATTKKAIAEDIGEVQSHNDAISKIEGQIQQINNAAKGRAQTAEEIQQLTALGDELQEQIGEGRRIAAKLNALDPNNETGSGERGYIYRKPRTSQASDLDRPIAPTTKGQYAGRRISRDRIPEFARRHGMTVEQATKFLTDEKAVIY